MYFCKRPVTPMGDSLLLIYTGSHSHLNPFNFRVLRLYCNKNTRINFIIIIIIIIIITVIDCSVLLKTPLQTQKLSRNYHIQVRIVFIRCVDPRQINTKDDQNM